MKMLLIGMLIMYLLLCLVATILEIVRDSSECLLVFLLLPTLAIFEVIKFVWVKVIHYGKIRVYQVNKGWYWKKKSEVADSE